MHGTGEVGAGDATLYLIVMYAQVCFIMYVDMGEKWQADRFIT